MANLLALARRRLLLRALDIVPHRSCRGILRVRREEEMIPERPAVNIHEVYADMKGKFDTQRYVKASHLNMLLNNCHTKENIDLGVEAIKGFRSSLSRIQISTGATVVRACCRVGVADKALEIMQNKIEYGVFFSKSAYDYLIQHFYEKKEFEKAVETYQLLLNDNEEIRPLWKTFHTAIQACCFLGTVDGIRRALELNKLSRKRDLFMRIQLYHSLSAVACQLSDPDLCLEIMGLLTEELNVRFSRAQVGLVIRARIMKGDHREAVEALESLPDSEQFEVLPHSTLDLVEVVNSSMDEHLQGHLKDVLDKFSSLGKKMPDVVRQTDETIREDVDKDRPTW